MASIEEIRRRKAGIETMGQITRVMKLSATVRLRRARGRAENYRLYSGLMRETVQEMLRRTKGIRHRYLNAQASGKKAIVVITSNRGLAGGYNVNVVRLVTGSGIAKEDAEIFAVGRKGHDALLRAGYEIVEAVPEMPAEPLYADAVRLARLLLKRFESGEIGEIYLAYTAFFSTVSQIPTFTKLLPAAGEQTEDSGKQELLFMNYEPGVNEALEAVISQYVSSLIYGAFLEAAASENGARMAAMDSAGKNAEEMLEELSLQYNRVRQSAITQELTEIIAGANAVER